MERVEVLSIVSFNNPARIDYLERSFRVFHQYYPNVRHVVIDGSEILSRQVDIYSELGIEYHHQPTPFSQRLKFGLSLLKNSYFVFLPDDFTWIFPFPLAEAIAECEKFHVDELKLTCRGMPWFAQEHPVPEPWHVNGKLNTGEQLLRQGDLYISTWGLRRSFSEQFSLACNIIRKEFVALLASGMPDTLVSPGKVEKWAYLRLYARLNRYVVAYYKMWIPAFHFIDLSLEGAEHANKAADMLIEKNFEIYNVFLNS